MLSKEKIVNWIVSALLAGGLAGYFFLPKESLVPVTFYFLAFGVQTAYSIRDALKSRNYSELRFSAYLVVGLLLWVFILWAYADDIVTYFAKR